MNRHEQSLAFNQVMYQHHKNVAYLPYNKEVAHLIDRARTATTPTSRCMTKEQLIALKQQFNPYSLGAHIIQAFID